ncbi:SAM-dependent methyltransferase, partial [Shewanella frigidimarina]
MENITTKHNLATERLPDSLARKLLLNVLPGLAEGHLSLIDGENSYEFGRKESDLHATIVVHKPRFYRQVLLSGSIGAGEAYIQDHWSSPDLTKVVQLFARNLPLLDKLEQKLSWLTAPFSRLSHLVNRNTEA